MSRSPRSTAQRVNSSSGFTSPDAGFDARAVVPSAISGGTYRDNVTGPATVQAASIEQALPQTPQGSPFANMRSIGGVAAEPSPFQTGRAGGN